MKCADLPTIGLLSFIEVNNLFKYGSDSLISWDASLKDSERENGLMRGSSSGTCLTWEVERAFPMFPRKLIAAKLWRLERRGYIDGCACGCRGDFQLTAKGRDLIHSCWPTRT